MASIETGRKSRAGKSLPDIPDKLYFRIGEVARLLTLPAYVLRFWETEFPQLKPGKGETGQRLYRRRDLDTLLEIRRLLYDQGYTIPGARQFLKDHAQLAEASQPEVQTTDTGPAELSGEATGLDTQLSEPSDAIAVLLQLRGELRRVANLLAHPVSEVQRSNPAHRGLHLAGKKRNAVDDTPTLFALGQDTKEQDPK